MFLKSLLAGIAASLSGLGFLRFSVLLESYALLGVGILLVLAGVMVGLRQEGGDAQPHRRGRSMRR